MLFDAIKQKQGLTNCLFKAEEIKERRAQQKKMESRI